MTDVMWEPVGATFVEPGDAIRYTEGGRTWQGLVTGVSAPNIGAGGDKLVTLVLGDGSERVYVHYRRWVAVAKDKRLARAYKNCEERIRLLKEDTEKRIGWLRDLRDYELGQIMEGLDPHE